MYNQLMNRLCEVGRIRKDWYWAGLKQNNEKSDLFYFASFSDEGAAIPLLQTSSGKMLRL
jgi:hypothetical protein